FMLLRGVMHDFHFEGAVIPAGYFVINSPLISHALPEVYRDPKRFDPERFGPGREEDKANFTFLSFGGGRHKCMGNAFALLQVKTIFAILLREYSFESMGDALEPEFGGVVLGPKQPCRIRYKRRQHQ
ncbi:MAG: cytochrome P450, partial [Polyangiales bacterium]